MVYELANAGHDRRADIYLEAWGAMEVDMSSQQVVGYRGERRVDLLPRAIAKRLVGQTRGRFGYHPYSNPSSRRTGGQDVRKLLEDVRNGSLWRACQDLPLSWQTKATYRASAEVLVKHGLALWTRRALYNRMRFLRWLFKAEGVVAACDEGDYYKILAGMGAGAERGYEAAGIWNYDESVAACAVFGDNGYAAAPGAKYNIDDLTCAT